MWVGGGKEADPDQPRSHGFTIGGRGNTRAARSDREMRGIVLIAIRSNPIKSANPGRVGTSEDDQNNHRAGTCQNINRMSRTIAIKRLRAANRERIRSSQFVTFDDLEPRDQAKPGDWTIALSLLPPGLHRLLHPPISIHPSPTQPSTCLIAPVFRP